MDHSQVVKYFDEYIKKYSPYQDNQVYTSLMEYISSTFTKELYENIPERFKQLYEDNYIHVSMYDTLLRNIGVPDKILTKLTINEKIILFKNFTDFYRYRGDIYFFSKISKIFEYITFDVYELYIDYDESIQDWIFKPYLIIKNTNIPSLPDISLTYDEIYDSIPSFLINKKQLSTYRDNKEIILPVKSNIILLDYTFVYNISEMSNLIIATFLKQYKTISITCYFTDNVFILPLKTFYVVWYYILLRTYGSSIGDVPIKWVINYIDSLNPYKLEDIDRLLQEYGTITNAYDGRLFYEKYIRNIFLSFTYSNEYDASDLEYILTPEFTDFVEYIDNRVESTTFDDKYAYNTLLDELLNSLILYISSSTDESFLKYSEYFINSLTRITLDPKKTSSYLLLHNYKPFHTEILTIYSDILFSNSKFDIVTPYDQKVKFFFDLQLVDIFNLIDFHIDRFIYHSLDNQIIFDHKKFDIFKLVTDYLTQLDEFNIDSQYSFTDFNVTIDDSTITSMLTSLNQLIPIDVKQISMNVGSSGSSVNLNDNESISNSTSVDLFNLSDNVEYQFDLRALLVNYNVLIDKYLTILTHHIINNLLLIDKYLTNIAYRSNIDLLNYNVDNDNDYLFIQNYIDISNLLLNDRAVFTNQYSNLSNFLLTENYLNKLIGIFENELTTTDDNYLFNHQYFNKTNLSIIDLVNPNINLINHQLIGLYDSNKFNQSVVIVNDPSVFTSSFNFNRSNNYIISFDLSDYINIGFNGLIVGDLVKYINDDDIHYQKIIGFDLTYNKIILETNYTGSNVVGYLIKKSPLSENYIFNQNYLSINNLLTTDNYTILSNRPSILNLLLTDNYIFNQNYLFSTYSPLSNNYNISSNQLSVLNLLLTEDYSINHYLVLSINIIQLDNIITIEYSNTNVVLYYTIDGSDPTFNDIEYINPIIMDGFTTLKVIAYQLNDLTTFSHIETFYPVFE